MNSARLKIRAATEADRDDIWEIFRAVIVRGDTYPFDPHMSRDDAMAYWFTPGTNSYVAELDRLNRSSLPVGRRVVGSYLLKPNQGGGGSHIANAAFIVAPDVRSQGVGRTMGEHCLDEARRLGFRAMQFNFVVSTNESAVHLWHQLGFKTVGTLPEAFLHPEKGYVDVYIMFRSLL